MAMPHYERVKEVFDTADQLIREAEEYLNGSTDPEPVDIEIERVVRHKAKYCLDAHDAGDVNAYRKGIDSLDRYARKLLGR